MSEMLDGSCDIPDAGRLRSPSLGLSGSDEGGSPANGPATNVLNSVTLLMYVPREASLEHA